MMVTQAYTIVVSLCSGDPVDMLGYTAHMGSYNPEKVDFNFPECYEEIKTKYVKPGIADTTWIDHEDKVIILKSDEEWKVEVRSYENEELFHTHVNRIREIEGVA